MNSLWANAEIISAYSRAQAIEDGELVDVPCPICGALVDPEDLIQKGGEVCVGCAK